MAMAVHLRASGSGASQSGAPQPPASVELHELHIVQCDERVRLYPAILDLLGRLPGTPPSTGAPAGRASLGMVEFCLYLHFIRCSLRVGFGQQSGFLGDQKTP